MQISHCIRHKLYVVYASGYQVSGFVLQIINGHRVWIQVISSSIFCLARIQVRELGVSICSGNFERAMSIVSQYPSSLCKIEESCFTYPIHMACARGAAQLVDCMLSAANAAGIGTHTSITLLTSENETNLYYTFSIKFPCKIDLQ